MRFISEFESTYGGESQKKYIEKIPYWEERGQADMGNMIGKLFGWKQREILSEMRHTLEIEAFPMEKWLEFKQKIFMECGMPEPNGVTILEMIKDLEFYSNNKQAVDELTNPK